LEWPLARTIPYKPTHLFSWSHNTNNGFQFNNNKRKYSDKEEEEESTAWAPKRQRRNDDDDGDSSSDDFSSELEMEEVSSEE
jgi:hypothetical protein